MSPKSSHRRRNSYVARYIHDRPLPGLAKSTQGLPLRGGLAAPSMAVNDVGPMPAQTWGQCSPALTLRLLCARSRDAPYTYAGPSRGRRRLTGPQGPHRAAHEGRSAGRRSPQRRPASSRLHARNGPVARTAPAHTSSAGVPMTNACVKHIQTVNDSRFESFNHWPTLWCEEHKSGVKNINLGAHATRSSRLTSL